MIYSSHFKSIENPLLFQHKEKYLLHFDKKKIKKPCEFQFSIKYLGVDLTIHHNDDRFQKELKVHFPKTWQDEFEENSLDVYLFSHKETDIQSFENEGSQDCVTFQNEGKSYCIQRDFIAYRKSDVIVSYLELKICDGFYNLFRWILPEIILSESKCILHSSCIVNKNSKAYFFLGPSGAGKSTMAVLSKPRHILGDDMNLISIKDGELYASAGALGGMIFDNVNYFQMFKVVGIYWFN